MKLIPRVFRKAVTTAATRERLTIANLHVPWVRIQAEDDNTGVVFVGDSQVSSALGIELKVPAADAAGSTIQSVPAIELSAKNYGMGNAFISLSDIWLDVATSADGVICMYLERVEELE